MSFHLKSADTAVLGARPALPSSSSLDPLETTERKQWLSPYRQKILDSFNRQKISLGRAERFEHCAQDAIILRNKKDPHLYRIAPNLCRDRLCPRCARIRAQNIAANLAASHPPDHLRFVTLTLRHNHEPLEHRIAQLRRNFKALRQRPAWQSHVIGGIAFLEVSYDLQAKTWHPHFHLLVEGTYWEQRNLADNWLVVTGDSKIVDIRALRDPSTAIAYVTQYAAATPPTVAMEHPDALDELIQATKHGRFVQSFGTWTKKKLLSTATEGLWTKVAWEAEVAVSQTLPDYLVRALVPLLAAWHRGSNDPFIFHIRPPPT